MRRIPNRFGIDFNLGVDLERAKLAGVSFVCRYHSDDDWSPHRNLTPAEARAWALCRTDIVSVWQNGKSESIDGGFDAGVREAKVAQAQQANCGGRGQPIIASVDRPFSGLDRNKLLDYFAGWRSVIGLARLGSYGGAATTTFLFDHGAINYGWQSALFVARPGDPPPPWDPRAQLRQIANADLTGGDHYGATDYLGIDLGHGPDFAQWRPTL